MRGEHDRRASIRVVSVVRIDGSRLRRIGWWNDSFETKEKKKEEERRKKKKAVIAVCIIIGALVIDVNIFVSMSLRSLNTK